MNTARVAQPRPVPQSLRVLLTELIDYAGLFPPAALNIKTAVENYARHFDGEYSWMLARFVVPISRLAEFEQAQADASVSSEWRLSALIGPDPETEIRAIGDFNSRNAGRARIDVIEAKTTTEDEIRRIQEAKPEEVTAYCEVSPADASALLSAIRDTGARAKIRTGGVTPEAFPSAEAVAEFIVHCAELDVPFKATAGLHHPLRSVRPLTYEPDAPTGAMHGFLNVFLAAAMCHAGRWEPRAEQIQRAVGLLNASNLQLEFTDDFAVSHVAAKSDELQHAGSRWAPGTSSDSVELRFPTALLRSVRQRFAISFGSCSFEEPITDLRELKLL